MPRKQKHVTKHTRAGKVGKAIKCPHCGHFVWVGHFAWSALVCPGCKRDVEKYEWLLGV